MQFDEDMPVDLLVFDMISHGFPAHFPAMSVQIRPNASWLTLFSAFMMLKNCPMSQP